LIKSDILWYSPYIIYELIVYLYSTLD
jgi:hypothetical protein